MKKCLTIVLILALGLLTAGCGKSGGRWVLIDSEFHEEEWYAALADESNETYNKEAQVSEGEFTFVNSYMGKDVSGKEGHIYTCMFPGNSFTTRGSWTEPAKIISGPKYEVSMRFKIETVDRHPEFPLQPDCYIAAEVPIPNEKGDGIIHGYLYSRPVVDGQNRFRSNSENGYVPVDVVVYGSMRKGERVGELRPLEVRVSIRHQPLMSYIYEWQE